MTPTTHPAYVRIQTDHVVEVTDPDLLHRHALEIGDDDPEQSGPVHDVLTAYGPETLLEQIPGVRLVPAGEDSHYGVTANVTGSPAAPATSPTPPIQVLTKGDLLRALADLPDDTPLILANQQGTGHAPLATAHLALYLPTSPRSGRVFPTGRQPHPAAPGDAIPAVVLTPAD